MLASCPASLRGERFVAVMLLQTYLPSFLSELENYLVLFTFILHISTRSLTVYLLSYIGFLHLFQELNVKKLTVSSEKDKYGIYLKAEPDNQTLGRRLKGAFKQVSQAIKGQFRIVRFPESSRPAEMQ